MAHLECLLESAIPNRVVLALIRAPSYHQIIVHGIIAEFKAKSHGKTKPEKLAAGFAIDHVCVTYVSLLHLLSY